MVIAELDLLVSGASAQSSYWRIFWPDYAPSNEQGGGDFTQETMPDGSVLEHRQVSYPLTIADQYGRPVDDSVSVASFALLNNPMQQTGLGGVDVTPASHIYPDVPVENGGTVFTSADCR